VGDHDDPEKYIRPRAVLDFPTRKAFARELQANSHDVVGISSIIVNIGKVKEMCRMVRKLSPQSVIVVGGHVTAIPGVGAMIDADHIVRGEGIRWMREFLGEDPEVPILHPEIVSGLRTRILGVRLPDRKGGTAATIIPSVGCPMGCNFCTTSSFFGGKGKLVNFFETGDQLFDVMQDMEKSLKVQTKWRGSLGRRMSQPVWADHSCAGRREERRGGWRRGRHTSRQCFWTAGIGG